MLGEPRPVGIMLRTTPPPDAIGQVFGSTLAQAAPRESKMTRLAPLMPHF